MKIVIITLGTRGDVQPYVALAQGLQAAGHEVSLATGLNFEPFVTEHGVRFAPLRADYYELMNSTEGKALKSGNPLRIIQNMKTTVFPLMRNMLNDAWGAAQNADYLIFHPKMFGGPHIAEKLDIPCVAALAVPMLTPTQAFPAPGISNLNLGRFNKWTYAALNLATAPFNGLVREWRTQVLGLPAQSSRVKGFLLDGQPIPVLYAYSRHVLPAPADWPASAHVTGYWFLEDHSNWQPPRDLLAFLGDGPAPVYVGFGSMVSDHPERFTQIIVEALQQAGQRGVIASGWGGLRQANLPGAIYALTEAPHDWLFPRMAAVVHHGGAGTLAAGLRAGKPTVVVPFMVDQPFWGNIVHKLGVGPQPIAAKKLSADALAGAIRAAVTDPDMRRRAEAVGAYIRAEDGVRNAVQVIGEGERQYV